MYIRMQAFPFWKNNTDMILENVLGSTVALALALFFGQWY